MIAVHSAGASNDGGFWSGIDEMIDVLAWQQGVQFVILVEFWACIWR